MRNIFKKKIKLLSLGDYVTYLKRNETKKFQLDVFRNNVTDLQIICSDLDYGIAEINTDLSKINLVVSFTEELKNKDKCLKNLKNSNLKFLKLQNEEFKERYLMEIERDYDLLYKTAYGILYNIYEYSNLDTCSINLIDFSKGNGVIIDSTAISYFEYLKKR